MIFISILLPQNISNRALNENRPAQQKPSISVPVLDSNQPTYIATISEFKVLLTYKVMQRNDQDDEQKVSEDRKDSNPIAIDMRHLSNMCFQGFLCKSYYN